MSITVATTPAPLFVCACCGDHDDRPLVWGPPATCPMCGMPCACEGCHAEWPDAPCDRP